MDWYVEAAAPEAVTLLRREVADYLRRHAAAREEADDAELLVSELLGNTARHAPGPVWVSLSWSGPAPVLTVRDVGTGFDPDLLRDRSAVDPDRESGRGLFLINHLAPAMEAVRRSSTGMQVSVELPVRREPEVSHDPPRRRTGSLPALEEARPEGAFGREAFLRALVVQMAQTVELQHGPDAAAAAVAQVGADVGGQMETEFRLAHDVVGAMSPEQISECYVRLKHAIDGGFYVVEASADRIVLGNTRCPFGDAVRRAPSLCRMTSSVFGGIAARNAGAPVTVLLEERIAVGDPGCRVVVDLAPGTTGESPHGHRYSPPADG